MGSNAAAANTNAIPRYQEFFQTGIEHITVQQVPRGDKQCAICRLDYPKVDPYQDRAALRWLLLLPKLLTFNNDITTSALKTVDDLDRSDLPNNNPVRIRRCNHVFGLGCLRFALKQSTLCPLCRRVLYRVDTVLDFAEEMDKLAAQHELLRLRDFLTDQENWSNRRITVHAGAITHLLLTTMDRVALRLDIDLKNDDDNAELADRVWHVVVCAVNFMDGTEKGCNRLFTTLERCIKAACTDVWADPRLRRWARLVARHVVAEQRILQEAVGADAFAGFPIADVDMIDEVLVLSVGFAQF